MSYEEIEVKFIIDDLPAMRQCVLAMGADYKTPRTYEVNVLFDTPDQRLQRQDCLLRLRSDHRHVLTYKEPAPAAEQDFKVRHEYEVEVSDFPTAQALLEKLGFIPVWRYEKYRETFTYQDAEILLDHTPCGAFLEIEGSREAIRAIATALGLDFETRLTASYGAIFAAVCTAYKLQVPDMTFDNFRMLDIDIRTCHLT
jgi:adenylate cyclase, class 2